MPIQDDPLYAAVVEACHSMVPMFHDGFEASFDFARQQLENVRQGLSNPSIQPDPWFFSHSVRWYLKQFLTQHGLRVQDYRMDRLPLSGLRFLSNEWEWRTRKSWDNGLPRLSRTRPVRAFIQQMLPGEFEQLGLAGALARRNLILLWHATPQMDEYLGISIIYRLGGSIAHPQVLGQIDIPARSDLFRTPQTIKEDISAIGDVEVDTIDISAELDMELTSEAEGQKTEGDESEEQDQ